MSNPIDAKKLNIGKKKVKFDAFVIIFLVIIFAYFLTLIIPSGEFAREKVKGA